MMCTLGLYGHTLSFMMADFCRACWTTEVLNTGVLTAHDSESHSFTIQNEWATRCYQTTPIIIINVLLNKFSFNLKCY